LPRQQVRFGYAYLRGTREDKYDMLLKSDAHGYTWRELIPQSPDFFFVPKDFGHANEYKKFPGLGEIFRYSNSALQTKRDSLTIHFDKRELDRVVEDFRIERIDRLRQKYELPPDGRDWTVQLAKLDVMKSHGKPIRIQHKPFDVRWTYYTGKSKGFLAYPRSDLTRHLLIENIALASVRQIAGVSDLCEVFVTRFPMTDRSMYSIHGTPYLFPFFLVASSDSESADLVRSNNKSLNLRPSFLQRFATQLGFTNGASELVAKTRGADILNYAYAIFHSPAYRSRYAELLKIDFPRLPLTGNLELFRALAKLGGELVALHLLESPKLDKFRTEFIGSNHTVEKVSYSKNTAGMEICQIDAAVAALVRSS
jgi:hypothetical protein